MKPRIKRIKKSVDVRIYDNLTALHGSKEGLKKYKIFMLNTELRTLNL